MENYSIAPRSSPPALERPDYKAAPSVPKVTLQTKVKGQWSSDQILAAIGLGLVLLGFAAKSVDPWVLWVGIPTMVGLVLYLTLPGFRKQRRQQSWADQREELVQQWSAVTDNLSLSSAKRYRSLEQRVTRLGDLFPHQEEGSLLRPGEYMLWLYLKLLLARDHLNESERSSHEDQVAAQRDALLEELESEELTPATRQSKQETVLILDRRILTIRDRAGRILEIESDLTRVEQWVALLYDQAAQHNIMGDSGRRIRLDAGSLDLRSLDTLPGANLQELDRQIIIQAMRA